MENIEVNFNIIFNSDSRMLEVIFAFAVMVKEPLL